MEQLFEEMIEQQKVKLLKIASEILPYVTEEDILQPNDFPALETNSYFRYEEGILAGLQSAQSAFLAERAALREMSLN